MNHLNVSVRVFPNIFAMRTFFFVSSPTTITSLVEFSLTVLAEVFQQESTFTPTTFFCFGHVDYVHIPAGLPNAFLRQAESQ